MKKRFLLIAVICFLISFSAALLFCDLFAGDHYYKFKFDKNPEPDMFQYRCIIYDAADSTFSNPVDTLFFNHHAFTDSVYFQKPFKENNRFLSFRVWAIDSLLQISPPGESNILKRTNDPPGRPANRKVRK